MTEDEQEMQVRRRFNLGAFRRFCYLEKQLNHQIYGGNPTGVKVCHTFYSALFSREL
jgi:hypothetical protein